MCATFAGTPSLSLRRKSISRYARLWPPPWCRVVIRPVLFRPPRLCRGRTSDFSGSLRVISTKSATDEPRRPGVVGLYLRMPISSSSFRGPRGIQSEAMNFAGSCDRAPEDLDAAFAQRDDGALAARTLAEAGLRWLALALAGSRVDVAAMDAEDL